ncbi:MAG: AraC family transcriptional regulator [Kofleriaceae bacterium]
MYSRLSDGWGRGDPLAAVLLDLRLAGTFFCRSEFAAPWSLQVAARDFASFHFCVTRDCWLRVGASAAFEHLEAGDLALVPGGAAQVLASSPRRTGTPLAALAAKPLTDTVSTLHVPGRHDPWIVICGGVRLEGFAASMLAGLLPPALVLRGGDPGAIVPSVLAAMQLESQTSRPGSATVMTRLADVIVIHAIRAWLERAAGTTGWLAALRDPQIGRTMAEVHRRAERAWSVAQLARVAGLSRSRFSERFSELAGLAPAQYVAKVQMHRAGEALRTERVTIAELAARFGYESEPAFARAFKRHVGEPPGRVRARARHATR